MLLTARLYDMTGTLSEEFYQYFSLGVLVEAISVFAFWSTFVLKEDGTKWSKVISELAGCSFGVYLIHLLVLYLVNRYIIPDNISFEPLFCVPVLIILVYFISFVLVWIFEKWKMKIELHLQ